MGRTQHRALPRRRKGGQFGHKPWLGSFLQLLQEFHGVLHFWQMVVGVAGCPGQMIANVMIIIVFIIDVVIRFRWLMLKSNRM